MKIIAFGASTSKNSINKALASFAANQILNAKIKVLDLNDYEVPIFSEDKEKEIGKAKGAEDFLAELKTADAIIVSFAEHNGSYSAAYKNLFDWATRIDINVFQNKPVVYLSASPGPGGAQSVLNQAVNSAPFFGAQVEDYVSVANFYDNFDLTSNKLTNKELIDQVNIAVTKLK